MENYLWETSPIEIYSVLAYCKKSKQQVLAWQLDDNKNRIAVSVLVEAIDPKTGYFYLRSNKLVENIFKKNAPIFLKFKNRELLLRTNINTIAKDRIKLEVPEEFKIVENRDNKRRNYNDGELKVVFDKADSEIIGRTSFTLSILDVSQGGMAIKYSVTKASSFVKDDYIYIKRIGMKELAEPLKCKIVHLTEIDKHNGSKLTNLDFKMGVRFVSDTNRDILDLVAR